MTAPPSSGFPHLTSPRRAEQFIVMQKSVSDCQRPDQLTALITARSTHPLAILRIMPTDPLGPDRPVCQHVPQSLLRDFAVHLPNPLLHDLQSLRTILPQVHRPTLHLQVLIHKVIRVAHPPAGVGVQQREPLRRAFDAHCASRVGDEDVTRARETRQGGDEREAGGEGGLLEERAEEQVQGQQGAVERGRADRVECHRDAVGVHLREFRCKSVLEIPGLSGKVEPTPILPMIPASVTARAGV